MKLPIKMVSNTGETSYYTETEVVTIVDRCLDRLCHLFKFSYHGAADMKQQGWIIILEALASNFDGKYNWKIPLDRLVYTHLRHRLMNFKRDNFTRNEYPCETCHNSLDGDTAHPDHRYCKKYIQWMKRNNCKQNVINPIDITNISDEHEPNTRSPDETVENASTREILELIDQHLPIELRSTYLRMKSGIKVAKAKRLAVEEFITELCLKNEKSVD